MAEQPLVYQTEIFWESWHGEAASYDPAICIQDVQDGVNAWIQDHPDYQILTIIPSPSTSTYVNSFGEAFIVLTYSVAVNYQTAHPERIEFAEDEEEEEEE